MLTVTIEAVGVNLAKLKSHRFGSFSLNFNRKRTLASIGFRPTNCSLIIFSRQWLPPHATRHFDLINLHFMLDLNFAPCLGKQWMLSLSRRQFFCSIYSIFAVWLQLLERFNCKVEVNSQLKNTNLSRWLPLSLNSVNSTTKKIARFIKLGKETKTREFWRPWRD